MVSCSGSLARAGTEEEVMVMNPSFQQMADSISSIVQSSPLSGKMGLNSANYHR